MNTKNIPVLILAGGYGTRISEETHLKPKPMIEVGDIPILIHLMRWYYSFGFDDFVICAGYRSWEIKQYFLDYEFRQNHLVIDHRSSLRAPPAVLGKNLGQEKWRVRVLDTGLNAMTGARVARALDEISQTEPDFEHFALTYGDGLSDVNLAEELKFHQKHGKLATLLGVTPTSRFGVLEADQAGNVTGFDEKPESRQGLINGGYFFFKKAVRDYLSTEVDCVLEKAPIAKLVSDAQLMTYKHTGFWYAMDTLRDKTHLQKLWDSGDAPWVASNGPA